MPARFNASLLRVELTLQHQLAPNARPRSVGEKSVEQNLQHQLASNARLRSVGEKRVEQNLQHQLAECRAE
jgi:hypothetical protein